MTIPSTQHLFWLRHDKDRFEQERSKLIHDYLQSLPEDQRAPALAMQLKVDEARSRMSDREFLAWMRTEAAELTANLTDQLGFVKHKLDDMTKDLQGLSQQRPTS